MTGLSDGREDGTFFDRDEYEWQETQALKSKGQIYVDWGGDN